jgi:formylglycine-generating enzyme required for sulfatase activity
MRFAVLVAAALVAFACSGSTSPDVTVGTYALATVDGQPLPYILDQTDLDTTLLTSSVVRLNGDDSWLVILTIRHTVGDAVHIEGATGTWTRSDTVLSLTEAPGGTTHTAALSGAELVVSWNANMQVMVYEKTVTDNTSPTVVGRSPAPGATGVPADLAEVDVTFSETMDGRTFTASSFTLTGPDGAVAGSVDYEDTWETWRFVPSAPLTFGATYTATIAGTVTDLAGNPLGADVTWSFTMAAFNMEFVLVPAGTFQMGDQIGDGGGWELPVHGVTLTHAFYLGKYEVTQAQWRTVMGTNPANHASCDNCPVEMVSWEMAQQFITALNAATGHAGCTTGSGCYRLPTEAEWEYAAKGGTPGDGTEWAGSNTVGDVAWYSGNSNSATHPVGQKAANGLGLYDMSGNVWEWVQDWFSGTYYSTSPATDPGGPATGTQRVLRGGSWGYDAVECRVANRTRDIPDGVYADDGFRLVRVQ